MWWKEVIKEVRFYDNQGNEKIEEISGKDLNQFESMCSLYAEALEKRWKSKVEWEIR